MTILNFGSLNIDHVYRVAHLVRPGETIASTPKFNGPEIFIMKILLIFDDKKIISHISKIPGGMRAISFQCARTCGWNQRFAKICSRNFPGAGKSWRPPARFTKGWRICDKNPRVVKGSMGQPHQSPT